MSNLQMKLEKKIIKHRNRNAGYHFQLPAFVKMVSRMNTVPMLDTNIVTLLEALMDLLSKIAEFDGYRKPGFDELDLNGADVEFSFGCQYCAKKGFNVIHALEHVMTDDHPQQEGKKSLQKFRDDASAHYQAFNLRKHELMIKNQLLRPSLDMMVNFCLVAKSFLKMTSRYLASLDVLEIAPSTIVAQGVVELLKQIDSLISGARCIESIPELNSMMAYLAKCEVKFVCKGEVFDQVHAAINHATGISGLSAPEEQNSFSLPHMSNTPSSQSTVMPGSPMSTNQRMAPGPIMLPNIVPFTAGTPIRMLPPPIIQVPLMQAGVNMQLINVEHQRMQQMMFSTDMRGSPQSRNMVYQQQQMAFQQAAPRPITSIGVGGGGTNIPTVFNSLPPLNHTGTLEHPILSADLKRFLDKPRLDSLITNGNCLLHFDKSSVIPGELINALKAVAPDVRVVCFGAKVSGVGYEEDFVNLYVDDGKSPKTDASVMVLFNELMSFFTKNCEEWVVLSTEEAGTRTHLTVKNNCENLCCRVTFASEIYCSNSKLIRYYMTAFPMCQKLCYFVQEFLKLIDLNFSRYVIVVLVIFYLQRRDYLPTVAQLQANLTHEEFCGPWLINFDPKSPNDLKIKPCETDLRRSATDFFLFYGTQFLFGESVVCPQIGLAVNRSDFYPENDWRMPLKQYKAYLEGCRAQDPKNVQRFVTTPMCVQDLLELTTNVSQGVHLEETCKFVRMCKVAFEFYSNNQ